MIQINHRGLVGKIGIGTAQFGMSYGILNSKGQVPPAEVSQILKLARSAGIKTIDTARSYKTSELVLGLSGVSDFDIVTKIPKIPLGTLDVKSWLRQTVNDSLKSLGVLGIKSLLLHHPSDLLSDNGSALASELLEIKKQGIVRQLGFSIYSPESLQSLVQVFWPDLIQVPLNIFDQRIISSGWLSRLKESGTEIHARSAFLQGTLTVEPESLPSQFLPWIQDFENFKRWTIENNCSQLDAALGFCLSQNQVDKVIVGIDTTFQLDEIIQSTKVSLKNFPDMSKQDLNLIDPSRWMY